LSWKKAEKMTMFFATNKKSSYQSHTLYGKERDEDTTPRCHPT